MRSEGGERHWDHWARSKLSFMSGDRDFSRWAARCAAERCRAALIARRLVRLLAGTANGAGNWPPGLRPDNKGKLSRSAAAPKRRSGLENGRSSSVRAEAVRLRPLVPNEDTSLVSVVLPVGNQEHSGRDLRRQVRQGTRKSASVRDDCHSLSHSFVWCFDIKVSVSALTPGPDPLRLTSIIRRLSLGSCPIMERLGKEEAPATPLVHA